jgi:succinate dehydrogenase / fumarate reductase cytochrome b subunit
MCMSDTNVKKERPLSPHLQIYKPQITSISSILHRMAGIALMLGLFLVTWGLLALAGGRETYEFFMGFCTSTIGQLMLAGWSAAFFYHMCTGLRHFFLDAGFLYEKKVAALSGWIVVGIAFILTVATWGYIYRDALMGGGAVL